MGEFTKAEKKQVRELAGIAWERALRAEVLKIGEAIARMEAGELNSFEVNEQIHQFHQKTSRRLYSLFTGEHWFGVGYGYRKGYLTDEDLAHCNDTIRTKLRQFMESVSKFESESPGEEE